MGILYLELRLLFSSSSSFSLLFFFTFFFGFTQGRWVGRLGNFEDPLVYEYGGMMNDARGADARPQREHIAMVIPFFSFPYFFPHSFFSPPFPIVGSPTICRPPATAGDTFWWRQGERRGEGGGVFWSHTKTLLFFFLFSRLFVLQFSRLAKGGSIVDFGCGYFLIRGRIWPSRFNVLSVSSGVFLWFGYLTLSLLFSFLSHPVCYIKSLLSLYQNAS